MEGLTQNEKIVWNCWEQKSPREVVREAAAKGTHINLAIKYLKLKNSWSESIARDWFMAEVSFVNIESKHYNKTAICFGNYQSILQCCIVHFNLVLFYL